MADKKIQNTICQKAFWGVILLIMFMIGSSYLAQNMSTLHAQTRSASSDTPAFVSGSTRNSNYLKQMVESLKNIEASLQRIEKELRQRQRSPGR